MSSQTQVLVKDVIESAAKYGDENVLIWDPLKFRDNKKNNKTTQRDCTWVPIRFKYINGTDAILKLKFFKVVTSSAAKSLAQTEGEGKKYMNINFRSVSEEELQVGDNVPKVMNSVEEQLIENEKAAKVVKELYTSTNDFNKAMEIIDKSYNKICRDMKDAKSLPFSIKKDKKVDKKNIIVYSIRQTYREDKDNEDKDAPTIKLDNPLTRIKLLYNSKTGYIGIDSWNNTIKGWDFKPNVYDARKIKAKNNFEPVLATVKTNGKSVPLDNNNAKDFITYRSIIGGTIEFSEIVISKFGLSLSNRFGDLYVKRNKSNLKEATFTKDEFKDLIGNDNEDDEESDVEVIIDNKVEIEESSDLEDELDE